MGADLLFFIYAFQHIGNVRDVKIEFASLKRLTYILALLNDIWFERNVLFARLRLKLIIVISRIEIQSILKLFFQEKCSRVDAGVERV